MLYKKIAMKKNKIIAIRINKSDFMKIKILRNKYFISTSDLFRKTIGEVYKKIKGYSETKH